MNRTDPRLERTFVKPDCDGSYATFGQAVGAGKGNLNRSLLARIETCAENLSLQTLSRLALACGVRPGAFL